jgi:hypothetical protein
MRLLVNVFIPRTTELLNIHQLTTEEEEQASILVRRYSAPVGLMCVSPSDLKKACREHVEAMIETEAYPSQATAGDLSPIPYLILEVIRQYCAVKEDVSPPIMIHDAFTDHEKVAFSSQRNDVARDTLLHEPDSYLHGGVGE